MWKINFKSTLSNNVDLRSNCPLGIQAPAGKGGIRRKHHKNRAETCSNGLEPRCRKRGTVVDSRIPVKRAHQTLYSCHFWRGGVGGPW